MFRKGALTIAVLSAVFSTLFYWWIGDIFKETIAFSIIIFLIYFMQFTAIFWAIYDIAYKTKVRFNKYMLGCGISGLVLFTALLKGLEYSNKYLAYVCTAGLIGLIIFGNVGSQYENKKE